jgi:hypothetical protein
MSIQFSKKLSPLKFVEALLELRLILLRRVLTLPAFVHHNKLIFRHENYLIFWNDETYISLCNFNFMLKAVSENSRDLSYS